MEIFSFSKGKNDANEDAFANNNSDFVVCDGVTYKNDDHSVQNLAKGSQVANFVALESLKCNLNGSELIDYLTNKLNSKFSKNVGTALCIARLDNQILKITQVGDVGFRVNGCDIFLGSKKIDHLTSLLRQSYIQLTNDIKGSRDFIMPLLKAQTIYKNNPNHPLGYGCLDGTKVAEKFIKYYEYNVHDLKTLEIFSDGYFQLPQNVSVADWENSYNYVQNVDPYKYKDFPSTKSSDDRTILIINF